MFDLQQLQAAIRQDRGVSRRMFLAYTGALAALPLLANQTGAAVRRNLSFSRNPFSLGVASGDPTPAGVVLWTRLAPEPLAPDYGMPAEAVEVRWELASDDTFRNLVANGKAIANPELGHSVHVELDGLQPDSWYWFRFQAGDAVSPIGRTRTMPAADALPGQLRFAFASCQNFEQGLFTAYQHMAQDELDLVAHLGDYIYEYEGKNDKVRKHTGGKLTTLADYRTRHAQYRSDPLLQNMHARCPWLVTWDDHEFENNYANDISERKDVDPAAFLLQRASAYQAYYEMMPLSRHSVPRGPHMQLYRESSFGRLAKFLVLDTRQYRSNQPNGDGGKELNAEALSPQQTLLGTEQKSWLKKSLSVPGANWNILAQQVMMGMVGVTSKEVRRFSMDQWPGYAHERMELVQYMADAKVSNPVVLTGDIHSNWVNDLRIDDRETSAPVVATEFVGTSISSGGKAKPNLEKVAAILSENPCVKFHDQERGYVRCTVTPNEWRSDYIEVEDVTRPHSPAVRKASYVVENGRPGAQLA